MKKKKTLLFVSYPMSFNMLLTHIDDKVCIKRLIPTNKNEKTVIHIIQAKD